MSSSDHRRSSKMRVEGPPASASSQKFADLTTTVEEIIRRTDPKCGNSDLYIAPRSGTKRLASIDALRGCAAVYVIAYHLILIPSPSLAVPNWFSPMLLSAGSDGAGVTLFFVLSAFSLCYTWRIHAGEPHTIRCFYIRRLFRIAPLFYFWIVLSWLRDAWMFDSHQTVAKVLLSASFLFNFIPGEETGLVWASWTIGVEMLFYAIFPLIFLRINNLFQAISFYLLTLAIAMSWDHISHSFYVEEAVRSSFARFSLLTHLPNFALGIALFHLYEQFIENQPRRLEGSPLLILMGAFLYGALISGKLEFLLAKFYWQGLIFGLIIIGLLIATNRLFVNPATEFWGEISYSLYLNHPTIILFLIPIYRKVYSWQFPTTMSYIISLILTLSTIAAFSLITYHFIERPGMHMGSRIIQKAGTAS